MLSLFETKHFIFFRTSPGYYNIRVILELFPHCVTFTKKCDKYPTNWMSSTIGVMLGISIMKTMPVLFILIFFFWHLHSSGGDVPVQSPPL